MKKVLIYQDYGCSNILPLKQELDRYFTGQAVQIEFTDAVNIIKQNALNTDVLMFVMPGGEANPYRQKLQNQGNRLIYDYVVNGGTYFGICAGAYYACRETLFEEGIKNLEIIDSYGLNLIEGRAIGTLFRQFGILPYNKTASSQTVAGILMKDDNQKYLSHYHGGPYFELDAQKNQKIEAEYDITIRLPAVVSRTLGQGKVILSGVHIENSAPALSKLLHNKMPNLLRAEYICHRLAKHEIRRRQLFDILIKKGLER